MNLRYPFLLLAFLCLLPTPAFSQVQTMDSTSYAAYVDSVVRKQQQDEMVRLMRKKEHELQKIEREVKSRRKFALTTILLFVFGGMALIAGGIVLIVRLSRR